MMDFSGIMLDPIYSLQGVPAALLLADGRVIDGITALDKTDGVDVGGGDVTVQTILPAGVLRVRELADKGVALSDLVRARLLMAGFEWKVTTYRPKPFRGKNNGEVYLVLASPRELSSESEPTE